MQKLLPNRKKKSLVGMAKTYFNETLNSQNIPHLIDFKLYYQVWIDKKITIVKIKKKLESCSKPTSETEALTMGNLLDRYHKFSLIIVIVEDNKMALYEIDNAWINN